MKRASTSLGAVCVAAGCLAVFSGQSQAAKLATKEELAKFAEGAEKYWAAPGSNYSYLVGGVIRPGSIPQSNLLARIDSLLGKMDAPLDKAALHYLAGETYYWHGMAAVMRTMNRSAMDGDRAVGAYLAAWEVVTQAGGSTPDMAELRRTIVKRLNEALATGMCGGNLSPELKQKVVARYIDVVEAEKEVWMRATPQQRAQIYKNLGIQDRLPVVMPMGAATNFPGTLRAMDLALASGATNEALRYAVEVETRYGEDLAKQPEARARLFHVYKACSDPRGIPCLKALAATDPKAWLALYDFSLRLDPKVDAAQRRAYIDEYVKGMTAKGGMDTGAYCAAVERLVANADYDWALELADKGIRGSGVVSTTPRATLWRHVAYVHEARGEKAKAMEALQKGLDDATIAKCEELVSVFRRELESRPVSAGVGGEAK